MDTPSTAFRHLPPRLKEGCRKPLHAVCHPRSVVLDLISGAGALALRCRLFMMFPVPTLHSLIYDILSPAAALIDYATGLEKRSANGEVFVARAQMAVSL